MANCTELLVGWMLGPDSRRRPTTHHAMVHLPLLTILAGQIRPPRRKLAGVLEKLA